MNKEDILKEQEEAKKQFEEKEEKEFEEKEEKEEKQPEENEKVKKFKGYIRDVVEDVFNTKAIPKGYTRCSHCGAIIKINSRCPYCLETDKDAEKIKEKNKEDIDIIEELFK